MSDQRVAIAEVALHVMDEAIDEMTSMSPNGRASGQVRWLGRPKIEFDSGCTTKNKEVELVANGKPVSHRTEGKWISRNATCVSSSAWHHPNGTVFYPLRAF